ncbi:PLP-dependent aminotransferase family protein [Kitasatospora sp. NPDC056783]|uniref:aminotransferase-like domain-containing protein n=1 Tax=Kitasatospora sp. NPDC056783 TaxID=3345943 RepID=UPI0036A60462
MTSVPAQPAPHRLRVGSLHSSLGDPALESMNFLNEIAGRFPDAVSFAPGRPIEEYFDLEAIHTHLRSYEHHLVADRGYTPAQVRRELFQYGRTKGVIHDLIARNLEADEGFHPDPDSVVVTSGCQEAMFLVLRALRRDERDVVLAVAPTYVGLTGAARLLDMPVLPVRSGSTGVDLEHLRARVRQARAEGLRPRACYLVPNFANPSGLNLDVDSRRGLLELAEQEDILLLEDNPYGLFHATGERLPSLKSMDTRRRVVYLGSFSKTAMPGARVGFAVADQLVEEESGELGLFADQLSKLKSMVTVNTSPISQAVVAGKLLEHGNSLVEANRREAELYRTNLRHLLDGLERHFGGTGITWNTPAGGFFLVLTVPFPVSDDLLELSAGRYGVLWTPMRHFYDDPSVDRQIRLSYSSLTPCRIDEGLTRLASFIRECRP